MNDIVATGATALAASVAGHAVLGTFRTRLRVHRRTRRVREDPPYVGWRSVTTQHLVRETLVMDRVVFSTEIDREEIDENVLIEIGCLGASDWRSRFADVIERQRMETAAVGEARA